MRQLSQCGTPAGVFGTFAQFCQAQKDVTGQIFLGLIELIREDAFSRLRNGTTHTARRMIALVCKSPPAAALPGGQQGMGKQGQRAGLRLPAPVHTQVIQDKFHQARFKFPAAAFGRFFNGAAQFCLCHLADIFLISGNGEAQKRILGAVRIKICTQGNHHGCLRGFISARWKSIFQ